MAEFIFIKFITKLDSDEQSNKQPVNKQYRGVNPSTGALRHPPFLRYLSLPSPPLCPLPAPLPSLPPLNPASELGSSTVTSPAGCTAEPRPLKHFWYISSPEIVSGGNDFGSFFKQITV